MLPYRPPSGHKVSTSGAESASAIPAMSYIESRFQSDPRDYALMRVEDQQVSQETLLIACLNAMSHDEVRAMLDANELSPRFIDDQEDDDQEEEEED